MNLFSPLYREFTQDPNNRHQKELELLKQFHRDILAWIDAGRPLPTGEYDFANDVGLCSNLVLWGRKVNLDSDTCNDLHHLLCDLFREAGLNQGYPFNNGRLEEFKKECSYQAFYLNPKRLAWIKEQAK